MARWESAVPELARLFADAARPEAVVSPESPVWPTTEYRLGLVLPGDFKELLSLFGEHLWGGFLAVLSPGATRDHLHLVRAGLEILGATHEARRSRPRDVPFALYPEKGGLFPWGRTQNGDTLFWSTEGTPETWPTVVVEARGARCERLSMSMSQVLLHFLQGTVASTLLLAPFDGRAPLRSDPWLSG